MLLFILLAYLVSLSFASPSRLTPETPQIFENVIIFTPPSNWSSHSTSYARTLVLNQENTNDSILLTTWSFSPPGQPYTPIYESTDGGLSWIEAGKVYFEAASSPGATILQPFLYELPIDIGSYPAGTILVVGNAIPANFNSTNIQLYASLDQGHTFEYVSTVAVGGPPNTANGATPVWEPFIWTYEGQLGVFYSDQRDPKYGQKLAHQTTVDLLNWGEVVSDVAEASYTLRPGMTTITEMGNGKFILFYELGFDPEVSYAVHYRIADNPFEFQQAEEMLLKASDGTIAAAGPQTVWTPAGGPNGTIVTSDSTYSQLFINRAYGDPSAWLKVASGLGVGYTRNLNIMPGTGNETILVTNGGIYDGAYTQVTAGEWTVPAQA